MVLYGDSPLANTLLKDEMVFLACVALVLSAIALVTAAICLVNFRKGLKPILLGQVKRQRPVDEFENDYQFQRLNHNVVAVPDRARRFDID